MPLRFLSTICVSARRFVVVMAKKRSPINKNMLIAPIQPICPARLPPQHGLKRVKVSTG